MNPEQQPAPNNGQYDFIINPQAAAKPKRNLLPGSGGSTGSFFLKLGLIIGGAVVLMIAIAIVVNVFFGSKTNIQDIVSITQTENELIRVSAFGGTATDQLIKNAAANSQQTISSQQQALLAFLKHRGRTVKDKELALKKNAQTDQQLVTAREANNYDSALRQTLQQELQSYSTELKTAFNNASDHTERVLLSTDYDQVQFLLKQLQQH